MVDYPYLRTLSGIQFRAGRSWQSMRLGQVLTLRSAMLTSSRRCQPPSPTPTSLTLQLSTTAHAAATGNYYYYYYYLPTRSVPPLARTREKPQRGRRRLCSETRRHISAHRRASDAQAQRILHSHPVPGPSSDRDWRRAPTPGGIVLPTPSAASKRRATRRSPAHLRRSAISSMETDKAGLLFNRPGASNPRRQAVEIFKV